MLGILLNERECKELHYMLRKEMDEMLADLNDRYLEHDVKQSIELRYKVVFRIYARLASPKDLSKYARNRSFR